MKKLIGMGVAALLVSGAVLAVGPSGPGGFGDCGNGGEGYGYGRMHGEGRGGHERMLGYMADELQLSGSQRDQIQSLLAQQGDPREQMRTLREQMRSMDPTSPDYMEQVSALAKQQSQRMEAKLVQHAELQQQIYALLTPQQQQRWSELHGGWRGHGPRH
ncbi:MAG TPA: Spy/CpxP family protein refolding chaperone [Motiliproteus sp.]